MQCLFNRKRIYSGVCVCSIFVIAFLFSLTAQSQFLVRQSGLTDSSVFQYIARAILNGDVPYRDTFDHKGPFLFFLNTLALCISPEYGLWLVEFISLFVSFIMMYILARLFCEKGTSVFVVLIAASILHQYFDGGNLTEEYALPFISCALYIFSDYFLNQKINRLRLFICGMCLGAVLLLRVNMIAVWVVMSLGVLVQCVFHRDCKPIVHFLIYFLLGIIVFVMPFIIWLAFHNALRDFWNDYILFNFVYSSYSESSQIYDKINSFSVFLNSIWVLYSLSIFGISFVKKRKYLDFLYFTCLMMTLLLICISGQIYGHYGMILIPIIVPALAYVGKACDECWRKNQLSSVYITVFLLIYMVFPVWTSMFNNAIFSYQHRGVDQTEPNIIAISSWLQNNTSPEEPIIVCGNWNVIYNKSNRFAASQYSYQTPVCKMSPDMGEEFLNEITENKPAAIILSNDFYAYDQMQQFISTYHYTRVFIDDIHDNTELYLAS